MRKDQNLSNYVTAWKKPNFENYKRVWKNATVYEKAFFQTAAKTYSLGVFTDLMSAPTWEQIDETDKKKLAHAIARILGE